MPSKRLPRPRVYVAGPITSSGNLIENVRKGVDTGEALWYSGITPFVPHLSEMWNIRSDRMAWQDWIDYDKCWLKTCHALFRLPGKSRGASQEVRFAKKNGLKVFRKWEDLMKWKKEWVAEKVAKRKRANKR